ncbi:polysaccharide deacetylase [Paenibacillus sp. PCH8]|uniref:polysaccharide deacetylase n=1 Tax=Paenibacillus sp. PCH8 TaxID=2066524 RepID=UPI0021580F2A|nr:polysaccharide deacetylase [Paenibacillus sp. PCH8]
MVQTTESRMVEPENKLTNAARKYNRVSPQWIRFLLRVVITLGVIVAFANIHESAYASGSTVAISKEKNNQDKIVYLSFDDGPGKHTREVLDILRKEQVPATFFVLGEQAERYPELIRTLVEDGHALGNHTFNHDYKQLYRDFKVFWKQIKQTEEIINRITGFRPNLVRAPGGSYGHFDQSYFDLLKQGGYTVMDWNVDSGDSKRKGVPAKEILRNATKVPTGAKSFIVLMHDGGAHAETVKALPDIIRYYRDHGYQFEVMKGSDQPVQFRVNPDKAYHSRKDPGKAWIAEQVEPNNQLWLAGKELKVEIGLIAATLRPGEFRVEDQQIMVPLRTFMKKFGSNARWDAESRTATVVWKDRTIYANSASGQLTSGHPGQSSDTVTGKVRSQGERPGFHSGSFLGRWG